MKISAPLRAFVPLALFLAVHPLAEAQEHHNAIGWNDGFSYRRQITPSWGIGAIAGVDLRMGDRLGDGEEWNSTDYSPDSYNADRSRSSATSRSDDNGLRSFHTSVEGFRAISLSNWIRLSPFARTEYRYTWSDTKLFAASFGTAHSDPAPDGGASWPVENRLEQLQKTTSHSATASLGLRPGVVLFDRIVIEKEFGLSLGYVNTQGESRRTQYQTDMASYRDQEQESLDESAWELHSFGWSSDLFSSIQIHVLF